MFIIAEFNYPMLGTGNPGRILRDRLERAKYEGDVVDYRILTRFDEDFYGHFFANCCFELTLDLPAVDADDAKYAAINFANSAVGDTDVELKAMREVSAADTHWTDKR